MRTRDEIEKEFESKRGIGISTLSYDRQQLVISKLLLEVLLDIRGMQHVMMKGELDKDVHESSE